MPLAVSVARVKRAVFSSPLFRIPILALGLTIFIELLNHRCFAVGFSPFFRFITTHPWAFMVNIFLVMLSLLPSLFWRRRCFACVLLSSIWLVLGIVNGFIQMKRSAPLTAPDLAELRMGLDTLPNYASPWAMTLMAIASVMLILFLVLTFLRGPRDDAPKERRMAQATASLLVAGVCMAGCWALGVRSGQLSQTFMNLTSAYDSYGFTYCFLQTGLNRGIRRPVNYSATRMKNVLEKVTTPEANAAQEVNIIFVQLESLVDPQEVEGLTLSADAMSNLRRLEERFSSGYLQVPVVGAGTANTEFEVLTGMSSRFFGPGEYPYKARAHEMTINSLAYDLGDLGYTAHAIHNNRATFYDRDEVLSNLGFDDFISVEYMPETDKTPSNWAEDGVLTSQILQALDATEGAEDFVYTITVQCHGSYSSEVLEDPDIQVLQCPEELDRDSMEYYVNQLQDTDQFVGALIDALEERGEKSVVVFFGDHLPSLGLRADQLESKSLFRTDYVIWDNLGLAKQDENLDAYQLSAAVLQRLGMSGGFLSQFHQQLQDSATYQTDLKAIQYDLLYGNGYLDQVAGGRSATELQLGIIEANILNIIRADGYFYVLGENFTPYYHVAEDEKILDTTYLSDQLLRVDEELSELDQDTLCLRVVDSHKEDLGEVPYDFDY